MKKSIWLINYNAMPPKLESRLRTIKFAHYLKQEGYNVKIFASSIMHNKNIDLIEDKSKYIEKSYGDLDFVHIKSVMYNSNGFKRLLSIFLFHFRLHFISKKFEKPDVILHSGWPPFGNITYFTARRMKCKYIVEVQDLWPESFVTFGLVKRGNLLLKIAYWAEKWMYKKADELVFTMEGGKDYIVSKKWDKANGGPIDLAKVHYINNGVDLQDFNYYRDNFKIEDNDLNDDSIFKVIYLGSLGLANNVKRLIDAAACLQDHTNIKFLIYGDGDDRLFLEQYVEENKLTNVIFKQKWIDPEYVPYVLSRSSLNMLNCFPNDVFKYGGSQSKFFQYLASGKPICSNIQMGYCQISKHNLGIADIYNSSKEYADAILSMAKLDKERYDEMCFRSRELSKEFDYKVLTNKMINLL
ncbi:MAG: glycosyltransferase family 4 protein [Bacteroidales bacterium]|nr:glycosyltransferase family 4 protein [Bacteroidales bacterium]